ncbi:hypothetical protein P7C70_g3401, partial [Phenoliferia sp. Uapishka_3]
MLIQSTALPTLRLDLALSILSRPSAFPLSSTSTSFALAGTMASSLDFKAFSESSATLVNDDKKQFDDVSVEESSSSSGPLVAAGQLSLPEAYEYIEEALRQHGDDPLYDATLLKRARFALGDRVNLEGARELVEELQQEYLLLYSSPYLEVRAAVDSTDDPSIPVDTFRVWVLGIIFVILGSSINIFSTGNLATIVLNRSFHTNSNPVVNGWKISQFRMFLVIFVGYFILPDALFTALSTFNWITWLAPTNVKLALICGSVTGLGLSPFTTFDWSYLSTLGNPLVTPLSATLNNFAGAVVIGLTIIPAIYFTNTFNSAYLPINSNAIFDNTGARIILAVTNIEVTLNVLAELVGGFALTGKPLAVMLFKAFGFVTTAQALGYASDLKLGHYLKIPPRSMFWAQLAASLVSVLASLLVVNWQNVIASALTASISVFGILYFFLILFPGLDPVWIGNTISYAGETSGLSQGLCYALTLFFRLRWYRLPLVSPNVRAEVLTPSTHSHSGVSRLPIPSIGTFGPTKFE